MEGAICKWDIIAHPVVTIRSFGWRVFFKALLAGRRTTFLSLLIESGTLRPRAGEAVELIGRCIALERRAMHIYRALARRFPQPEAAQELFTTLARHEQGHADMLRVCQVEAGRARPQPEGFVPWQEAVPRVEFRLHQAEASLNTLEHLDEALRIVVQIESSEINRVFSRVVAATDSDFVRALDTFRTSGEMHLAYIRRTLAALDPSLGEACQELTI